MKRIINLAVIGIIAVAGNVQAQTIKEDFDNGVSSFGIAYSARYDTKLPEIFPETEYVYGGAASMEMIPTGTLPYNKSASGKYFKYQGVYSGEYAVTEKNGIYSTSACVMTKGSNVKMKYIVMNNNDIISVSKEYELLPSMWLNAEYTFKADSDSDKNKIILAFYSTSKNSSSESIYIDDFMFRDSYIKSDGWKNTSGSITSNGGETIFTDSDFKNYNELTYTINKSELPEGKTALSGKISSDMEDTYIKMSCDEIENQIVTYHIGMNETVSAAFALDSSKVQGDTLTFRIGFAGKASETGTVTMSDFDIRGMDTLIDIRQENGKLVISGNLKTGNENRNITLKSDMFGDTGVIAKSDGSYRTEKNASDINAQYGMINVKLYGAAGYPNEFIETSGYYVSDEYRNTVTDAVKKCTDTSALRTALNDEVLNNLEILKDPIFRKTESEKAVNMITPQKITSYEDLENGVFGAACLCAAESGNENIYELLKSYEKYITNIGKAYEDLFKATKQNEFNEIYSGFDVKAENTDDFVKKIAWTLVKNKVKGSSNYSEGMSFVKKYADELGLNLTVYKQIESTSKGQNAALQFVNYLKSETDYTKAQNKLNSLCTKSADNPGGGSSGGSGSSKPSGGFVEWGQETKPSDSTENTEYKFSDIDGVKWAEQSIYTLLDKGIISENDEKLFYPSRQITRAEFAKMTAVMLGIKASLSDSVFADVSSGDWYFEYVTALYEKGIINGTDENHFSPESDVSRQDICVILSRAFGLTGSVENDFADADKIADYAREAVAAMKKSGIVGGYEDNTFRPENGATRAETAKILCGIMNNGGTVK